MNPQNGQIFQAFLFREGGGQGQRQDILSAKKNLYTKNFSKSNTTIVNFKKCYSFWGSTVLTLLFLLG